MSAPSSLALTPEEQLLRDTARAFAQAKTPVAEVRRLRDAPELEGFSRRVFEEMAALGWAGLSSPVEVGGSGAGLFATGVVMEQLGRELVASPLLSAVMAEACLRAGGPDAQSKLRTEVAEGRTIVALAPQEGAGHDPDTVRTVAERTGGGYRLSGRKTFVIDGQAADGVIVVAQVEGGIGLFLVDPAAPGVTIESRRLVDARHYAQLDLDRVAVGEEDVVGPAGEAARMLDVALDRGAAALAAEMLGGTERALELTIAHLQDRHQFGVALASLQALQHRVARLWVAVEVTRSVVAEALRGLDDGAPDAAEAVSTAKAYASDTFRLVTGEAVQLHGGLGITDECDIGLYLKRARVAERLLGDGPYHRRRLAALQGF